MPRRKSKATQTPDVPTPAEKELQALKLAQERLLARRQNMIPLQVMDDWPLSPFQGEEHLPRTLIEKDLAQVAQQPRSLLRHWAIQCLEQVRLSGASAVSVDRRRWHDLQMYSAATEQLIWPKQASPILVNYSSSGFRIEPFIHPEDDPAGWRGQRHLRFDEDGEWLWGTPGKLWQPYVVFPRILHPKIRFRSRVSRGMRKVVSGDMALYRRSIFSGLNAPFDSPRRE